VINELKHLGYDVRRWTITTSILGVFGILVFGYLADQFAQQLGIPTWLSYGLAGLDGIMILALNWRVNSLSTTTYGWPIIGFLIVVALQTIIMCVYFYIDFNTDSDSDLSLLAMGIFPILLIRTVLFVAWRLKVASDPVT
jgi:uncharacterized membrane protein AbrB (regulator of aidB expression)